MKVDRLHLTLLLKWNWPKIFLIYYFFNAEMASDDLELNLTLVYQCNESVYNACAK